MYVCLYVCICVRHTGLLRSGSKSGCGWRKINNILGYRPISPSMSSPPSKRKKRFTPRDVGLGFRGVKVLWWDRWGASFGKNRISARWVLRLKIAFENFDVRAHAWNSMHTRLLRSGSKSGCGWRKINNILGYRPISPSMSSPPSKRKKRFTPRDVGLGFRGVKVLWWDRWGASFGKNRISARWVLRLKIAFENFKTLPRLGSWILGFEV